MDDFSEMTTADFDRHLIAILDEMKAGELITIPGVYEIVSEELNNAVLDRWSKERQQ